MSCRPLTPPDLPLISTRQESRVRSELIADALSPERNRRLELPFSFEVAA